MNNYRAMNEYYNYVNNNYNIPNYAPKDENTLFNPYQGLIRGNLFPNLYNYYKNEKPYNISPANQQAELLTNIYAYGFAIVDLNLYLDVHPDDKNAINLFNQYVGEYKIMVEEYTRRYGRLEMAGINANQNKWTWVEEPWPWQKGGA